MTLWRRLFAPTCVVLQVPYNGSRFRLNAAVTDYTPIDCSEYDWLEIACMDGYLVELGLRGRTVTGVAEDLKVRDGKEYLRILLSTGMAEHIPLEQILSMTVLTRPARFTYHAFSVTTE